MRRSWVVSWGRDAFDKRVNVLKKKINVYRTAVAVDLGNAVAENLGVGRQAALAPVDQRGVVEAAHRINDGVRRTLQVLVGGHSDYKRPLVLRSSAGLAVVACTAEIRIVHLHESFDLPRFFPFGRGLHDLVFELPERVVAHTRIPLPRQR